MRRLRDGTGRSSYEVPDKRMEQRRCIKEPNLMSQPFDGRSPMKKAKPFCISKKEVWEAYQRVKANKGAAGTDGQTIEDFERKLKKNLYKIWNRMVVKAKLEPEVDAGFHVDSYGYRPGKSALDAVGQARQRCWRYDWVIDLDIKAFFDNLDQSLLLRAVKKHASQQWMVLYIERWLKAPVQGEDGRLVPRAKGTPQGGVVSPLLANLFLHYALDRWMAANYAQVPFERYADDVIVHCRTEREAKEVRTAIAERLRDCGLELHPEKTKIVYCKDGLRKGKHTNEKFDFLGYEFRPRRSKNRNGKVFLNFSPAISTTAAKATETRFGAGKYLRVAIRLSKSCHGSTIQSSAAGSNITGGFTARRSARSGANWTQSRS